ncbi:MAG TPA: hypothetical protein IAC44_02545 [Candidatus Merdimorpha stercoravium]|uniref:Uncharacterized protein n=1 Tax=Candidatus Merdimorpha stercoravium TaxID=2840863 RepID=A0A9D1H8N8_9FLAO|nr:hypothetical protein [Candidatus Merdimorpha stercoravium]
MKGERSGKGENKVFAREDAEPHSVLSKDRERRAQSGRGENKVFAREDAEPHPVLSKDNQMKIENRSDLVSQYRLTLYICERPNVPYNTTHSSIPVNPHDFIAIHQTSTQ